MVRVSKSSPESLRGKIVVRQNMKLGSATMDNGAQNGLVPITSIMRWRKKHD
jgi:hypothetical protein